MPEGTSKVQNAVKYDPMIHISPSSMIPWYTLHLQVWSHDTHYTVKHEPMIHITPSSMNPWYTLHRQAWSHDTHYTVKHEPMIHITPSSMSIRYKLRFQVLNIALQKREFFLGTISSWRRPLYNSHLQPHGHYTHYTFNLMSVIHNTPSTAWPLYTLHLQPHVHYTQFTFNQMAIIHISPSTTWSLYNNHLWTHGHYTHVPSNRWPLYTRTVGEKRPCSTLPSGECGKGSQNSQEYRLSPLKSSSTQTL